jgi:hypothetical protein
VYFKFTKGEINLEDWGEVGDSDGGGGTLGLLMGLIWRWKKEDSGARTSLNKGFCGLRVWSTLIPQAAAERCAFVPDVQMIGWVP